jgi:PKD repeat protein
MKKEAIHLFICVVFFLTILSVHMLVRGSYDEYKQNTLPIMLFQATDMEKLHSLHIIEGGLFNYSFLPFQDPQPLDDRTNTSPVIGTPSPYNGSMNNPLSFTWKISINDTEGDLFDWKIECNSGDKNESNGDTNGTKYLPLLNLTYNTTYQVSVYAIDVNGSGNTTIRWFTFQTKESFPPIFGSPTPSNDSSNQPLDFTWMIPINDPEGDRFSWSIKCSNGQNSSGSDATNGTQQLTLSNLNYGTTYIIWVNATDEKGSGRYTRKWYYFHTKENSPPVFSSPNPSNGSQNQPLNLIWTINITDPDGDFFDWSIECNNGQNNTGSSSTNGSKNLSLGPLAYSTAYSIWVNASDISGSDQWTRRWYTLATQTVNTPPLFGTPSPANQSIKNPDIFTWNISISDPEGDVFNWTIYCNNGQNTSGTGDSNGTKSLPLSGLDNLTTYTVWVNATDSEGSGLYTRHWYVFTTKGNLPPSFGSPNPSNRSASQPLSLTWRILITDPDGDSFSWTIECNNGQDNTNVSATNGTKTLTLSGLSYSTTYTVWVNATDQQGSGLYIRRWYRFTTTNPGGGQPPPEEPPQPPSNQNPVADASAGSPYRGYVNEAVLFDGSDSYDPDGVILDWEWQFGDGNSLSGRIVNHTYTKAGSYIVKLTVTDTQGATDTDIKTCAIKERNKAPTPPVITGPTSGTKNIEYTYTAVSTDTDNDSLLYTFHWGDGTFQSSGYLLNDVNFSTSHRWLEAGRYNLTVTVSDNHSESSKTLTIYIDALQTRGAGYLIDYDSDGIYDAFYSDETKQTLSVLRKDGSYLIDKDGDGNWDYVYSDSTGLTSYQPPRKTPGFEMVFVLFSIVVFLFLSKKKRIP